MNARRNRGLAAVELALVLPIFVVLLLATAELGRALYQYNILNKAVRDGAQYLARYAIAAGHLVPTSAQLTAARNLVVYGVPAPTASCLADPACALLKGMDPNNDVTITPQPAPGAPAGAPPTYVYVEGRYTFLKMFTLIPNIDLKASVTMVGL